ncbi:hypothetical protein HPB49_016277 [Dermacentor silvarum]|uniref:Uncharacterized protein n=1 Tax=Dermacentor silvarum TaxID=543639 RepID=A0ACB8DJP0_DERSI|nr:hypothetical protein HPB49_016277 [Dermacentor silvarum]
MACQAIVKVILLLKKGYEEAPPELSCTELSQQWRRPRGNKISGCSVAELDWRSSKPSGLGYPTPSRLHEARRKPRLVRDAEPSAGNIDLWGNVRGQSSVVPKAGSASPFHRLS